MKRHFFILLFFSFLLVGCDSKSIYFSGESDNWKGDYTVNINGTTEDGEFIFGYKEATSDTEFENLEIMINDGETIQKASNHKGATVKVSTFCSGCAVTREDEVIKVTIKWNDNHEETFNLVRE